MYEEYLATIEDPKPSSTVRQSELASMRGKVSSLRMHLDALEPLSREPQRLGRVLWSSAVDGWALMTLDNRSLIPSADSICDSVCAPFPA